MYLMYSIQTIITTKPNLKADFNNLFIHMYDVGI